MGCFNLRSLLLAAFVISNCITWTASRHHFTHNASGHRSRHRRQGAGLYLPASYVIPGGAGGGAWGDWGEVSPCSRTCGGGVASQKRICLEIAPDGRPQCSGGDTKFFSCQTQDCPAGAVDFRAEQCSQYDEIPFKGIKHKWIPYTKGPKQCELNCMPKGERFYYRHRAKVTDGTRCNDESFDVCVDGTCQPVGCDMMLGSNAREDKCRECRGNGTNCYSASGLIDTQDLRKGYNDILLIPQGATSIYIAEVKESNNYLALRAKQDNVYYLNGDYHIDFPRTLIIAGAPWHYERSQQGFAAPDKLRCMGPTMEPLYLSLLLQDENVGINYEYSIPTALAPPPNQQYIWVHDDFTPCSATCGGGIQTRTVTCRSREELDVVDESLCDAGLKPSTNETCNLKNCPATWVPGDWSPCSKPCGEGGTRSRQVHCQKIITNGVTFSYPSIVDDQECFDLLGEKPPLYQECNKNASCPTWFTGPWKPCDKLRGEGKQTRQVVCYQKSNGRVEVLAESECADEKPPAEQSCMIHPSEGVDWVVSDWSGCDNCLSLVKSRSVECATKDKTVVDPKFCTNHKVPMKERPCNRSELPPCQVQWYATQWSNCSVECGKGVKTRRVFCGQFDGVSVVKVDDAKCANETKYNDTTACEIPKEKCPAKWFAGPWSECTKRCGGGERYRKVMCLSGGKQASDCAGDAVLDSTQTCNTGPCDPDLMLPVNARSSPVMDETDECEDYDEEGSEEDGEEVGAELDSTSTGLFAMFSDAPSSTLEGSGFWETESEFTAETGSGAETTWSTEASGSTSTDTDYTDETTETGLSSETSETVTDLIGSDLTEVTKESAATETSGSSDAASESNAPTATSGDTASGAEGSTESAIEGTGSTDTEITESTNSTETEETGSTVTEESGSMVTEETGSTVTEESGSMVTEETGSMVTEETGSTVTEETGSTVTGETGSTVTGETGSTVTGETGSTVTGETGSTETEETDSTVTEETGSTVTEETGSTETEETGLTESEETGLTEAESTGSTETEEMGSTVTDDTVSTVTEETSSTETDSSSQTTEVTTEATDKTSSSVSGSESGSLSTTENSDSSTTEAVTESEASTASTDVTGSSETELTGSTETTLSGTTDVTGASIESEATTTSVTEETGSTETDETTETEETGSVETETTGSTEVTETGSTETELTGSTETEGTTELGLTTESGSIGTSESEGTELTASTTEISSTTEFTDSEETSEAAETTPWDWTSTVTVYTNKPICIPKNRPAKCIKSTFGCCPDKKTPAAGPFDEGCPNATTCNATRFGCCPDGVSPAAGRRNKGCPSAQCNETLFGCCKSDNSTPAEGNDQEGCPPPPPACKSSEYGCCKDGKTEPTGPGKKGCPETTTEAPTTMELPKEKGCEASEFGCCYDNKTEAAGPDNQGCPCSATKFGCCPDNTTAAGGAQMAGCVKSCNTSAHGCCPDGQTPAHGPDGEGCCLLYRFGCCPDNYKPADGPHLEGCGCQYARFGCCPDNVTIARGPNKEECGCQYTQHGCCPDRHTEATGNNFEGCSCHTYQFGCCPDGVTVAKGPNLQGCDCRQSTHGCCGDGQTPAIGPDQAGCDCASSKFGCCPDGQTEAKGQKFSGCTDVPENKQAACSLAYVQGPCHNYSAYWFFDMQYGGCSRFWYGGCEGNGNRFATKEECEDVCVRPTAKDICRLPKVPGGCRDSYPRWYYDAEYEQCGQFEFSGCLGNANNFETRELCQAQCQPDRNEDQCKLPIERGSCAGSFSRWGFNAAEGRCEQFAWGGCEGNTNRFSSEAACVLRCQPPGALQPECTQPQDVGNCTEKQPAWSFSETENRCLPFYYTGCGGNGNRFDSEQSCAEACPSAFEQEMCTLPAVTGECSNYQLKWYFDTANQRCRQFYYGGCGGNGNNFATEKECRSGCAGVVPATTQRPPDAGPFKQEYCFLEKNPGPCSGNETRWAYSAEFGDCQAFQYGGCDGNRNNFPSREYCLIYCKPTQDVCQLPMKTGPCRESLPRWFYDAASDRCSQFAFGGCQGNENNFDTADDCERRCRSGPETAPAPTSGPALITTMAPTVPRECIASGIELCRGVGRVWFLDPATSTCEARDTPAGDGDCRAPGVFPSPEACERTCGAFRNLDVCRYSVDAGPCTESQVKFYFDAASRSCRQFTYGGCHGGANRFSTIDECENICVPETDPCKLRPEPGNCVGYNVVWYYDEARDDCNQFVWTGCSGNGNRFPSREECESQCKRAPAPPATVTAAPQVTVTVPLAATPAPATTHQTPEVDDECRTPDSLSPCGEEIPAFYYDSSRGACLSAQIGACRYPNSYRTEEECERRCGAFKDVLDVCRARLDPGRCYASIPKLYWDIEEGRCRSFTYGGCEGGPNRFSSLDECEEVCGHLAIDPACLLEVDAGVACGAGAAGEPRWHRSAFHGECRQFIYLGCGGNTNNFLSFQQCEQHCSPPSSDDENENEIIPVNCSAARAACAALRCEFGRQVTRAADGCERCACVAPDCRQVAEKCAALKCPYGLRRSRGPDGCEKCSCNDHPCANKQCPAGERCVPYAARDPVTAEILYSSDCRPEESNEIVPDCGAARAACAALRCEFGRQVTRAADGCERCACVARETNCSSLADECARLKCTYGLKTVTEPDGCERCRCNEQPCARKQCPAGERCVVTTDRDPITAQIRYNSDCRTVNKPGWCPAEPSPAGGCRRECADDADCRGAAKCCAAGCSQLCREPAAPTSPATPAEGDQIYCTEPSPAGGCRRECADDADCRGAAKCCAAGCSQLCREPAAPTSPATPAEGDQIYCTEPSPAGGCRRECADDADCRGAAKCCAAGCSQLCREPAAPTSPATPAEGDQIYCTEPSPAGGCRRECADDADCRGAAKCCAAGCSQLCREPAAPTSPATPAEGDQIYCTEPSPAGGCRRECADDADCRGAAKCCAAGCSQLCREPAAPTSPATPAEGDQIYCTEPSPAGGCRRECADDADCRGAAKCCAAGCSQLCREPAAPTSPATPAEGDQIYCTEPSPAGGCRRECADDADCRGAAKCCAAGCSQLCREPAAPTSPATPAEDVPQAPQADPDTESEVTSEEGGMATLRCLFHSNPPPKITWKRGQITIDGNVGRYRLTSDGALEIVSLYRNDSGVYICVAENDLGSAQQEIQLRVNDPKDRAAGIAGEPTANVVGEIGRPLSIRCLAYGFPQPSIAWYRGPTGPMVPYDSRIYEARGNVLLIRALDIDSLGEYTCQAYNGISKPASWTVVVRAYRLDRSWPASPYLLASDQVVMVTPRPVPTDPTVTTSLPIVEFPEVPVYTVPVRTELRAAQTTLPAGSELNLPCEVDGHPEPDVYWTKDGERLAPSDRMEITAARLTVSGVSVNDSGVYGCHANNGLTAHQSSVQITVQELYIPSQCTDNQFFANCQLIVRSKFCNHTYYSKFCCKSCVEAGLLNPQDLQLQADQSWMKK